MVCKTEQGNAYLAFNVSSQEVEARGSLSSRSIEQIPGEPELQQNAVSRNKIKKINGVVLCD